MIRHRSRRKIAALLLLLCLFVGGVGVLVVSSPSLAAAISKLFHFSESGDDSDSMNSQNSTTAGTSGNAANGGAGGKGNTGAPGFEADPHALPKGLNSIDGEGGAGFDRAVKKNGVWYPVYSPGLAKNGGAPPLTVIPLTISSGSPPPGKVGVAYQYQAAAIGGTEPYKWSATLSAASESFVFDPATALLSGTSLQPETATLTLTVKDAADATASAQMMLVMRPEKELAILTADLPRATLEEPYTAILEGAGGVPPYRWTVTGKLPAGVLLATETGEISGTATEAGEYALKVSIIDSQQSLAERELSITASADLEITTETWLPPIAPGEPLEIKLEARGGVPPLTWTMVEDEDPDPFWGLSTDGVLSGFPDRERVVNLSVKVSDSLDGSFQKTFHMPIADFLTAIPSLEKVGLAWHPARVNSFLAKAGLSANGYLLERDGDVIYQGAQTNIVDHNQPVGSSPTYVLSVVISDGSQVQIAKKSVTILPMTLQRAEPGVTGDPYADRVTSFQPLTPGGYGYSQMPGNVTGPPDGKSTYAPASKSTEVASLHAKEGAGGAIELEFTDNIVELAPGEDVTVFENVLFVGGDGNYRFMEPGIISVALFPGEWHRLPTDVIPPADGAPLNLMNPFYYARGFAGRNGTTGDDPTDPSKSGGDSLDLDQIPGIGGLSWIRYIRIQSTGDNWLHDDMGGDIIRHNADPAFRPLTGLGNSGFDLDAVSAVHY